MNIGKRFWLVVALVASLCPFAMFRPARAAAESVVYDFGTNPNDGGYPLGKLINVLGNLYGTTYGVPGGGTIFRISPSGSETVLHTFSSEENGEPVGDLIFVQGKLYGAAFGAFQNGGGAGSIYSVTIGGSFSTLYNFSMNNGDGESPFTGLLNVDGTLYGTTLAGGNACALYQHGCGTVYSITLDGFEKILYRFADGGDGAFPESELIDVGHTLYGTTEDTGLNGCGGVFSITTSGEERTIYIFKSNGKYDGCGPTTGMIKVGNRFYGTT